MKVEFELTYDGCMTAMLESTKRHPSYGQALFVWRWGIAGSALALTTWFLYDQQGMASLLVGLGAATMVSQAMPWILKRWMVTRIHNRLADYSRSRVTAFGKRQLELLPEGMRLSGPQYDVFYKWSVVESVERRRSEVFVFFKNLAGIAIPASALDADAFIAEAQRLRAGGAGG